MEFDKAVFDYYGGYLTYDRKFVARFKYKGKGKFITFLVKNFTQDEYFSRLDAGETPVGILKSKGYNPLTKKEQVYLENLKASRVGG